MAYSLIRNYINYYLNCKDLNCKENYNYEI